MAKVICPGELLIDFVCTDKDRTIKSGESFVKKAGGAPANVAVAIKKMGTEACILGAIGNDQFGSFLEDTLSKYNVNTDNLVKLSNYNTTMAFVSLTSSGERDFIFNRGADAKYKFDMINKELLKEANVFHFGSATAFLGDELEKTYYNILNYGVKNNKIIIFDPNYRESLFGDRKIQFIKHCKLFISYTDVLKVSDEEAKIITRNNNIELADNELINMGAKNVLITLGSKGTLFATKEKMEYVAVNPVKMKDATGAGDAFIGAVISKIAQTEDLSYESIKSYIELGNKVGSITVQKYGALDSIPYLDEIE